MTFRPRIQRHQGLPDHHHDPRGRDESRNGGDDGSGARLSLAFVLTAVFLVVELATGLWTNSLALISDAFHMLSDTLALGLAAWAARIGLRRPTPEKTYGFKRFEVLAAFANAILLAVFGVAIAFKAAMRLWHPEAVHAEPMLAVAVLGLVLNLGIFVWIYRAGRPAGGMREEKTGAAGEEKNKRSLNEEGVLWHVAGDAFGSVAAIGAGLMMIWGGWMRADAVAGLMTASLLLFGAQRVARQSAHILVEGTPPGVDASSLRAAMAAFPQVRAVHDFHLWTLTGRDLYLSAHLEIEPGALAERDVAAALRRDLEARFGVHHITLQAGPCGPEDCGNDCG